MDIWTEHLEGWNGREAPRVRELLVYILHALNSLALACAQAHCVSFISDMVDSPDQRVSTCALDWAQSPPTLDSSPPGGGSPAREQRGPWRALRTIAQPFTVR